MLLIPIKPEPAGRIRTGRKWFELRKSRPPHDGPIYLLETSDPSESVNAIRTCIITDPYIHLPLEELWERVGEYATSRKKFEAYFGSKYKTGVAIPIVETQLLANRVTLEDLVDADPTFRAPSWPWTYHEIPDHSPAGQLLANTPRENVFFAPIAAGLISDPARLGVRDLTHDEVDFFRDMYGQFVEPYYAETEGYAEQVLVSHFRGADEFGYLTLAKRVVMFLLDGQPVGFTVATEKRGGSVKFGPTVVHPSYRELRLGRRFRILTESLFPHARKFYNTLPADSDAALRYVLQAGYRIEAHLRHQYSQTADEIVVGKLMRQERPLWAAEGADTEGRSSLHISCLETIDDQLAHQILSRFEKSYGELDPTFVDSLREGLNRPRHVLGQKPKQIYVAHTDGGHLAGVAIVTPKRGGSLKCSPFSSDSGAAESILRRVIDDSGDFHKVYLHVPLLDVDTVRTCCNMGFLIEGVLAAPYRDGVDMAALGLVKR